MENLNSLANANPAHRIQNPNSVPRSIGMFGLGSGGKALAKKAAVDSGEPSNTVGKKSALSKVAGNPDL